MKRRLTLVLGGFVIAWIGFGIGWIAHVRHTHSGMIIIRGNPIPIATNHWYWVNMLCTPGFSTVALYDGEHDMDLIGVSGVTNVSVGASVVLERAAATYGNISIGTGGGDSLQFKP